MPSFTYPDHSLYVEDFAFCIIYGDTIRNKKYDDSAYRAIYPASVGVKLTGLGSWAHDCPVRLPDNQAMRWDTMGHNYISLVEPPRRLFESFLFHDRCWTGFGSHFVPKELDLDRLYAALEYFPLPKGRSKDCGWAYNLPNFPTFEQLIQSPKMVPQPDKRLSTIPNPSDWFGRLPLEIHEIIVACLSTRDALNLRCASRAMVPLFECRQFWRTRFDINGERGFLAPLVQRLTGEEGRRDIDWRILYHCTCKMKCGRSFDSRIRAWEQRQWLRDATISKISDMPLHFSGRALQSYHNTCYQNEYVQTVELSPSLTKIAILAIEDPEIVYITGMEFIFEDDRPNVRIGHTPPPGMVVLPEGRIPKRKVDVRPPSEFAYPGVQATFDARGLRGFEVARGVDGVHLIQVILDCGPSGYMGFADFFRGMSWFTIALSEVKEVVATFDHHKMLGIGIRGVGTKLHADIRESRVRDLQHFRGDENNGHSQKGCSSDGGTKKVAKTSFNREPYNLRAR